MKKLLAICVALLMTVGMMAACGVTEGGNTGSTPAPADNGTSTSTATSAAEGDSTPAPAGAAEVIVNLAQEPPMMNSILTTSTGSMNVLRHIVDGLTMLDPNDEPIPAVAESWEVSEDSLTYTFTLRQGMKWNNGEEVTANDFVFAWDTFFTAETAAAYASTWAPLILGANEKLNGAAVSEDDQATLTELGYEGAVGYKAIDDYTLQVTTTGPYPYFLSVLAFPSMLPINEKGYTEIGADAYGTEADLILTNGAYKLASWSHESNLVLEKNQDYWDAANIKLDKITMEMIADTGTALNSFRAGEIDMIGLNGEQSQMLRGEGLEVLDYDDGSCWYFEFDNTKPGLNNAKVRKAMTLAVDAQSFVDNLVKNKSKIANNFTPPAISNGSFSAEVGDLLDRVSDGDYSAVKALFEEGLAEEGLTAADVNWTIICDEGDTAANYNAFFQEQWRQNLGIEVAVEQMTYKNRIERMQNHDFDIVMAGWGPDYNDPMTFLDLFVTGSGNNHTQYTNPAYDELVQKAMTEADPEVRKQHMIDLDTIICTDFPIGPIYNRARDYVCSEKLAGVVRTAFDDMNFRWAYVPA